MKAKGQRPRCGDCSHLREKTVSDVGSVLWCDIPNGNRKVSRDQVFSYVSRRGEEEVIVL